MALEEKKDPAAPADNVSAPPDSRLDIPEGEKPDLLEYLAGLPDVEGEDAAMDSPLSNEENAKQEVSEIQAEEKLEITPELLAELIRSRAKAALITPLSLLQNEKPDVLEMLNTLSADEAYKDIICIKGDKDSYYYSNNIMSNSFANIAVLVEEKDDARTLAHSVRERSAYPALTYARFFMGYPFNFSAERMEQVKAVLKSNNAYEDIQTVSYANVEFFYSTQSIKPEIASYLAEELVNERP